MGSVKTAGDISGMREEIVDVLEQEKINQSISLTFGKILFAFICFTILLHSFRYLAAKQADVLTENPLYYNNFSIRIKVVLRSTKKVLQALYVIIKRSETFQPGATLISLQPNVDRSGARAATLVYGTKEKCT